MIDAGDWVECIFAGDDYPPGPEKGDICLVIDAKDIGEDCDNCSGSGKHWPALWLKDWDSEPPFCACSFRPIYLPKASFIEGLKEPVKELEPA